jgi:hypothetical protein
MRSTSDEISADSSLHHAETVGESAKLIFSLTGGTIRHCQITGGAYSIVMNQGANPSIDVVNALFGEVVAEPTWSNMQPSAAPEPELPVDY